MRFLRRVLNIFETPWLPPPAFCLLPLRSPFLFFFEQSFTVCWKCTHTFVFIVFHCVRCFQIVFPICIFNVCLLCVPGGEEIGGNSSEEGKTMATSKMDNMTCRSKECVGKPLQVVATQLPYVFRYLANELFAMNIRMNLTVSST